MTGMVVSLLNVASWSSNIWATVLLALISIIFLKIRRGQASLGRVPDGLFRPPCLSWLPVIGSLPFMITSRDDLIGNNFQLKLPTFFLEKSKQLGNVIAFYSMSRYTVVLNGRKTISEALIRKGAAFADRRPSPAERQIANPKLLGFGFSPFSNDLVKRRKLALTILKELAFGKRGMELHIQRQIVQFIKDVEQFQGKPFDPAIPVHNFITGVIFSFLFGRPFENNDPLLKNMVSFTEEFVAINAVVYDMIPLTRLLPKYKKLGKAIITSAEQFFDLVKQEVSRCLSNQMDGSFAYRYAEKEGPESLNSDEFLFVVRDLIGAGSSTSQQTIRWLLKMLANHDDVQQRLHAEVDECYGKGQRLPSIDDISKLPLVAATILETMRIETLMPFAVPHQTQCDTEVDGYFIPKGTMVLPNLYSAHVDPDDWVNPHEFQPDRFIDSTGMLSGQERILSFSLGKRACIGEQLAREELFIFLASLLRHFHVLPPEGQSSIITERECGFDVRPSKYDIRMIRRQEVRYTAD